ncbi:MAG TPA: PEP/pyruvate-binding domain-containing protein, partial [Aggregatilineales bacterium]|nr:PEP/pyruvate-binding domain-containing protein [Aggregatilineales bacterium]
METMRMVGAFNALTKEEQAAAGGKGGTLARLFQAGYPVPDGFVILPSAFDGDALRPDAWTQAQMQLAHLRKDDPELAFAVRSSALSEDSAQASFAGEFESLLDVRGDAAVREAILAVRRSRESRRVQTYSQAQGMSSSHEIAVVVQRLIRAQIAGVLFSADPLAGSRSRMTGNFVHGLGERLVSGEANPESFTLARPGGKYCGPGELKPFARTLYRLAERLERDLGCPQDMEWAMAGGNIFLLQSRPITTLVGNNPATGEWNDSLTGDYLWTNVNFAEGMPDVMTPLTWSVWQLLDRLTGVPAPGNYPMMGNIAGHPYANLSYVLSLFHAVGLNVKKTLHNWGDLFGNVPEDLDVPLLPLNLRTYLVMMPRYIMQEVHFNRFKRSMPEFLSGTPDWCREMQ